ncbi:MAG: putative Oxidoreductase with FAD/NAD(P)-binding domain [Acidobacteria bacterium]|nr:putative Oxidoreductase with FAD/NAD(P)-binding domain [Acidobacteriota bacterium]
MSRCDVAVIGAGAAGLMAAIFAARAGRRVVAIDGAARIGAKILISGGGRCNVTHHAVSASDFNGNRNQIAKVLREFDVQETVDFFHDLGVELKREETGKLFPVSDRAKTIVDALLTAAHDAGVELLTSTKVTTLERGFLINGTLEAERVILAAGGRSVPKTGSDGSGYALARALGHTVTPLFPALVPLMIDGEHPIKTLSGTSVGAEVSVRNANGRVVHRAKGSMLFTHFGLSGPLILDVSRHWLAARPATLAANLLPGETFESLDSALLAESRRNPHATIGRVVRLPERLVAAFAPATPLGKLSKESRRAIARTFTELELPVTRDRGFDYAEVTAGGVPLDELDLTTMESRHTPGLHLCGEILDVDGRIGGFNFQWAWSSGVLAGRAAGR